MATKQFINRSFGTHIETFFSPEMYKGTCVDREIHKNLLNSDKCIVCITSDNFKNPWLMYESGVVYGSHHSAPGGGIVIPILFEYIPEWSSWVDKPLNRYVPIRIQNAQKTLTIAKNEFKQLFRELSLMTGAEIKNFNKNWNSYINEVQRILESEQLIPNNCKDLFNQIMEDSENNFTIVSPEITANHILFHKGFSTNAMTKLLLHNIVDYQGKRLWLFGRRNKRLFSSDSDYFFKFLAEEGLKNGVNFRCLFPMPNSDAMNKAVGKDKERRFKADLQVSLEGAVRLKNRFNLPIDKMFRLYKCRRPCSIVIIDNTVLYNSIPCDGDGYPLPMTNSPFEMLGLPEESTETKATMLLNKYEDIWNQSIPLTEELYKEIYNLEEI